MNYTSLIRNELSGAAEVLKLVIQKENLHTDIEKAARLLVKAFESGNKVIACGNGGSHCDAMHFAEELTGRYRENRNPFPAIAISDATHISCVANDYGFSQVFSRYIQGIGNQGDVLLAISTSGNSENIIEAVKEAHRKEMKTILLTGEDGGKLAGKCDIEINVPSSGFSDRIQEVHIKIIHIIILLIERMT